MKLKDITSSSHNRAILHRLKNSDPGLTCLYMLDEPEDEDEFIVREGDDLGWLGYFIGRNETLKSLYVYYLPTIEIRLRSFSLEYSGTNQSKQLISVITSTRVCQ